MESALVFDVIFCGFELNELTKFIALNIKIVDFLALCGCAVNSVAVIVFGTMFSKLVEKVAFFRIL